MRRAHPRHRNWRLGLLIITLMVFGGHFWLPPKRLLIHPGDEVSVELYGYDHAVDGPSGRWLDRPASRFLCDFKPANPYGCGFVLLWHGTFMRGIDLSGYSGVLLDARYEGPAGRVRLNMRNANPAHTSADQPNSPSFMSASISAEELNRGEVYVDFQELSVAEWWLMQDPSRRKWTASDFRNISSIGVDMFTPGLHKAEVNRVELIGEWISTETLLGGLVGAWMLLLVAEGAARFYLVHRNSSEKAEKIEHLRRSRLALEREKEALWQLSRTDPLTNVPNRAGVLEVVATARSRPGPLGLLLIDLDHFRIINDRFGHDAGDVALKKFAAFIASQLRTGDCFGRWGGEQFVLVSPLSGGAADSSAVTALAEKVRELIEQSKLASALAPGLELTASIGATTCAASENFETAVLRAEAALQQAKQDGRNRVVYHS